MTNKLKVGICQMMVVDDKKANIDKAAQMIRQAAESGCKLVVLPEMFNCPYDAECFPRYAETYPEGETFAMLEQAARENNVLLIGGSLAEREGEYIYNTCFVFDEQGNLAGRHRKLHLFDVNIKGGTVFKESATLSAGSDITVIPALSTEIGVIVCYDIRFPELLRATVLNGAKMIVVPAAFGPVTGPAHWELLMRSRAMDNQAFVVAASPARNPWADYQAYGHSMVVDPWGKVIVMATEKEGVVTAEFDPAMVEKIREEMPLIEHRRPELYGK